MSHILYGDFYSEYFKPDLIKEVKDYAAKRDIYYWFNDEVIGGDKDINIILKEHSVTKSTSSFFVSSSNQPTNSDDVLFPFDKYNQEDLFPNGYDDRTFFIKACRNNLYIFKDTFNNFIEILKPNNLRVFISIGYNRDFIESNCNIDQMILNIENQVKTHATLSSAIYNIRWV